MNPPTPTRRIVIESRRTLLEQSSWFYWLTAIVGVLSIPFYWRLRRWEVMGIFAVMFVLCLILPVASRAIEHSDRLRMWLFPRKLKSTREGKWYVGLVIFIGFAAVNSGDNLLYLILSMMLSFVIASGILSEAVLKRLRVRRAVPRHVFAGNEFQVHVIVRNHKKWLTSYSLLVEDPSMERLSPLPTTVYFFSVAAGGKATASYTARIDRRGRHALDDLEIATKFPYNFFIKSMTRKAASDVLVYPRLRTLQPALLRRSSPAYQHATRLHALAGAGETFYSLREYQRGDNPRRIHWRVSARQNKWMVREYQQNENLRAILVFDNYLPPDASEELKANYERALSFLASAAHHFIQRNYRVELHLDARQQHRLSANTLAGAYVLYQALAELQPATQGQARGILAGLRGSHTRGALLLTVSVVADKGVDDMTFSAGAVGARSVVVDERSWNELVVPERT